MTERFASIPAAGAGLSDDLRREIERWFVGRGVPQLVEGYSSEPRMDARAAPLIAAWLVIGTILFWGINPDWPPLWNVAGIVGTLFFIGSAYGTIRALRGRPVLSRQETFDPWEIGLLAILPAIPAGAIDGSPREIVVAALNALLGIGVIYVIVGFGLVELGAWALGRLGTQVAGIVGLLARTLPVLLILVTFLLFSQEAWEAAQGLDVGEVAAVIVLLLLIGAVLIVTTFRAELRRLEERDDWGNVASEARTTPLAPLVGQTDPPLRPPPLTWIQRLNLTALALINQLLQSTFVALLVMAFLLAFGLLTLPVTLQDQWVSEPVSALLRIHVLGEMRTLSVELVTLSAVLSGIVGLYFTGLAVTDAAHRTDFNGVVAEARQLLSARAVYLAALRSERGSAGEEGFEPSIS